MEVVNMDFVDRRSKPKVVGFAIRHAAANAATSHEHRKAVVIVIAAIPVFRHRSAAKFAPPDDKRVIQHPCAF